MIYVSVGMCIGRDTRGKKQLYFVPCTVIRKINCLLSIYRKCFFVSESVCGHFIKPDNNKQYSRQNLHCVALCFQNRFKSLSFVTAVL